MILYHGSFLEVTKPDLVHSRHNIDFGCGFHIKLPKWKRFDKL